MTLFRHSHDVRDGLSVHEQPSNTKGALESASTVAPQVQHEFVCPSRLHFDESVFESPRHNGVEVAQSGVAYFMFSLVLRYFPPTVQYIFLLTPLQLDLDFTYKPLHIDIDFTCNFNTKVRTKFCRWVGRQASYVWGLGTYVS